MKILILLSGLLSWNAFAYTCHLNSDFKQEIVDNIKRSLSEKNYNYDEFKKIYESKSNITKNYQLKTWNFLEPKIKSKIINAEFTPFSEEDMLLQWFYFSSGGTEIQLSLSYCQLNLKFPLAKYANNGQDFDDDENGFISMAEINKMIVPRPDFIAFFTSNYSVFVRMSQNFNLDDSDSGLLLEHFIPGLTRRTAFSQSLNNRLQLAILFINKLLPKTAVRLKDLFLKGKIIFVSDYNQSPGDNAKAITFMNGDQFDHIEIKKSHFDTPFVANSIIHLASILVHEEFHSRQTDVNNYEISAYRSLGIGYYDPLELPAWKTEAFFLKKAKDRMESLMEDAEVVHSRKAFHDLKNTIGNILMTLEASIVDRTDGAPIIDTQKDDGKILFTKLFKH